MVEKLQLNNEVSRRYGKALFNIAKEQSLEDKMYQEVNNLINVLNNNSQFNKLFGSPLLSSKDQLNLVENIFSTKDAKKVKVSKNLFSFIKVLAFNRRLKALHGAMRAFIYLIKSMHKEVNVNLVSAVPLADAVIKNIADILANKTDYKINIISSIDKNIIGGIILQSGSNLIDTSIRSKILKINNVIKGS